MGRAVRYRASTWLRGHAAGAALMAVLVGVVLAPALTLLAGARRTSTAPDRYVEAQATRFDVAVWQDDGAPMTDEIAALPGVHDVAMATFVFAGLVSEDAEPPDAVTFAGRLDAIGGRLTNGREPDPSEPGEFVASDTWMALGDAEIGDSFTLMTISGPSAFERGFDAEPDGPTLNATLVGVFQNRVSDLEDAFSVTVFGPALLDAYGPGAIGSASSSGSIDLAPGVGVTDLRSELEAIPGGDRVSLMPIELIGESVLTAVSTRADALWVLAIVVSGAALVVMTQLSVRLVRTSASERAVLASLGYTTRQSAAETVLRAAPAIAGGAAIGSTIAWLCSTWFPYGFASVVEPQPGRRFDATVHAAGAGLCVVLVLAATWVFSRERSTTRPADRSLGRLVARVPSWTAATGLRLAFGRRVESTNAFVVGLGVVLSIAVAALTVGHSLGVLLDTPADWGVDFDAGYGSGGQEVGADVIDTLVADPAVRAVTLYGATTIDVDGEPLGVVAYSPVDGGQVPRTLEGRLPQAGDEVAMGTRAARRFDVGVGDDLLVRAAGGEIDLHVVGVAVFTGIEETDGTGDAALVSAAGLERLDPDDAMSSAAIYLVDDAPTDAVARIGRALGGDQIGPFDRPSAVVNLDRVRATPSVIAAVVGAMGLLSLALVVATSVRHGRRELAILRALGATPDWRWRAILWQGTAIGSVVVAIAVASGVIIGRLAYSRFPTRIGAPVEPHVPLTGITLAVATVLVVATVTATASAGRIRTTGHDLHRE